MTDIMKAALASYSTTLYALYRNEVEGFSEPHIREAIKRAFDTGEKWGRVNAELERLKES